MNDTAPAAAALNPEDVLWRRLLTFEERKVLLAIDPWRSAWTVAVNWLVTFAAMALVAYWPNVLTVVAALFIIGARQLGMAIVMHEAAHRTLFKQRWLNDFVGNWLAAYPVWTDLGPYRAYHLKHHAHTWTAQDPDIGLALPFPITPESFRRKVWRDLSGQTGVKQAILVLNRDLGRGGKRNQRNQDMGLSGGARADVGWHKVAPVALTNVVLLALLTAVGHPALYLLWVGAWLTTYRLLTRIRAIAEHSMASDPADQMRNTRTTIASWWERLLIAPNRVNFHLEHHLMMTVPHHNLPRLHRLLRERGALEGANVVHGYREVLRQATSLAA